MVSINHRESHWPCGTTAPIAEANIIGPAFIGYATEDSLTSDAAKTARQLDEGDRGAVAKLRTPCSTEEWNQGGSDFDKVPTFGAFDVGGGFATIASFERWQDKIVHISIVTTRERRGRVSAVAVALAAAHALNTGFYRSIAC
jgi:hypothetical protein